MKRISLAEGLEDKGVIVTGAASGIGRAAALVFAENGGRVCAIDRDDAGLHRLERELSALGGSHLVRRYDLAVTSGLESLIRGCTTDLGGLRALVNAAALLVREPVESVSPTSWDDQVDVNLKATFFLDRAAGEVMSEQGTGGRIVNFTSAAWLTGPLFGSDVYVATKTGVIAITRGFAKRLGPHGITVNVIAPGQVDTPMQHRDNDPNIVAAAATSCPLGRMGTPEEIGRVAVFLASTSGSFISGATITVAGGAVLY